MRIALLVLLLAGLAAAAEIKTARGDTLAADVHRPEKPNGAAVVIAPGQGYHKDLPLIVTAAEQLAGAGFLVVRFNWAYFAEKGRPSPDLSRELDNVEAALAHARRHEGVTRVLLAGKSLGTLAALERASRKSDDLGGIALLTFAMHLPDEPGTFLGPSAKLATVDLPVLVVTGDNDRLCQLKALYGVAARAKRAVEIVVVPGDHSLKDAGKDESKSKENIDLAVKALVVWAKRRIGS
jgi:predicted alpha/beta-hydrolase family hydrolase